MIRSMPTEFLVALTLMVSTEVVLLAADGDPVAVRQWPSGAVSIETHWGLQLAIDPTGDTPKHLLRTPDRIISPSDSVDHYLIRLPNESDVSWRLADDAKEKMADSVRVRSIESLGNEKSLLIEVDGVQIVYVPKQWFTAVTGRESINIDSEGIANPDLLIVGTDDASRLGANSYSELIGGLKPKKVLLSGFNPTTLASNQDASPKFIEHNTLALSKTTADPDRIMTTVVMSDTPWKMSEELEELFHAMEQANTDSQKVFAKLSVNQLNFKPANGTHTPRWNAEHMMGRQLLFFSQIYHAIDPTIPVIDLNPKQMPPDYVFKHPDWDGQEEARQMQRVSDFTRRFAYLLDGVELDKKAPDSRWTLFGLLKQMQRHYGEHTANTIKKFELAEWPES